MIGVIPITVPQLPPKAGYVEVEVDGVRTYMNVETGSILGEEPEAEPTTEERVTALEDAIAEGLNLYEGDVGSEG